MKRLDEQNFRTAWEGFQPLAGAAGDVDRGQWPRLHACGHRAVDAEGPARLAGCGTSKGRIAKGFDADFVVFDPEAEFIATEEHLHYRHRVSPYLGEKLRAK